MAEILGTLKSAVQAGTSLLDRARRLVGETQTETETYRDRRRTARMPIPMKVLVSLDGGRRYARRRLLDINQGGLGVASTGHVEPGQRMLVVFDGLPDVAPGFNLSCEVVRPLPEDGAGVRVDRAATSRESIELFGKLALYYLRHKPLMERVQKGYFEGHCRDCGWIGRVGGNRPVCAKCGGRVKALE
jgi:hypothetical protein